MSFLFYSPYRLLPLECDNRPRLLCSKTFKGNNNIKNKKKITDNMAAGSTSKVEVEFFFFFVLQGANVTNLHITYITSFSINITNI